MTLRRWLALVAGLPVAAVLLLGAYGYAEATRDPVVVRYAVQLKDWPADTPPLRIAQLSDTHVSWPDMPPARLDRIVAQVNALRPDVIVLTGDYHGGKIWDRDIGNMDDSVRPLQGLHARYGVFAVRGNHDGPYWTPIVFGHTAIRLLQNRWASAGPITVAGVDSLTGPTETSLSVRQAIAGAPPGRPIVLLSHEPEFFQWLQPRVDLLIAGHTHGGQIVLPVLGYRSMSLYLDAHRRGRFDERGKTMIVSSGIGTSIVPLRIGVPPEIALITLSGYSVGRKSGTDR